MFKLRSCNPGLYGLGARRLQLCLSLRHIDVGCNASTIAGLRQLQRLLKIDNRRIQQLLLQVQPAQRKVIDGKLRVQTQANILKISRTGLCISPGRLNAAPHLSPKINLIRDIACQTLYRCTYLD